MSVLVCASVGSSCWPGLAPAGEALCLCFAKEKYPKERRPDGLGPFASLRATCGARQKRGLARTRLRLRQSQALIRFCLRSSAQPEGWGADSNPGRGWIPAFTGVTTGACAQSAHTGEYATAMFARERSTRGHMRVGSGESLLLSRANRRRSVMPQIPDFSWTSTEAQASAFALSASVVNESAKNSSSGSPPSAW